MNKPYVVSADIYLLLKEWAIQNGFILPTMEFFSELREEFSSFMGQVFSNFELVSEDEISLGLADLVIKSGLPAISLDRVYFRSKLSFEIARLVDKSGQNRGLGHRAETPLLSEQVRRLQRSGVREVVLVDDVIFFGDLLARIIHMFSRVGIRVPVICAGIGIAEGIKRINGTKRDVYCVRTYDEVIDEVCERDFYPGVPLSGRLLVGGDNIGIPYLLPFGNPESWASIPTEHTKAFSKFCLHQTILLFEEIERCSGNTVLCQDLERKVVGLPTGQARYTEVLSRII
jgi:hypothetical protein